MKDKYKIYLFVLLIFLVIFSIYALKPQIAGDSYIYINSIEVLKTGIEPSGFIPMMIVSTYLGLRLIMFFNLFTGNIEVSWLLLDSILYIAMGLFSYSLFKKIIKDDKLAFLGTLFLVTNYAAVSFGLGYLMDIGGWTAYIASLYFAYRYLENEDKGENKENKWLYISAAFIGIGGLYKEYAFVAYVIIFGIILYKNWSLQTDRWSKIFWKVFITGCLAFMPFLFMNVYTYYAFNGYTYLDWFLSNQTGYSYQNRTIEFIKSFGSIYNFGWFLFVPGFYILLKQTKEILQNKILDKDLKNNIVFIWLVILSSFSVLLWPVVTRVLFITMPAAVIVSSLFVQRIKKDRFLYIIIPIFILYFVSSYLMNAYILDFVNLPI
ncbi:MAG: glycosyltransferase family 39 protein [Patescibacteria group bacterium]